MLSPYPSPPNPTGSVVPIQLRLRVLHPGDALQVQCDSRVGGVRAAVPSESVGRQHSRFRADEPRCPFRLCDGTSRIQYSLRTCSQGARIYLSINEWINRSSLPDNWLSLWPESPSFTAIFIHWNHRITFLSRVISRYSVTFVPWHPPPPTCLHLLDSQPVWAHRGVFVESRQVHGSCGASIAVLRTLRGERKENSRMR